MTQGVDVSARDAALPVQFILHAADDLKPNAYPTAAHIGLKIADSSSEHRPYNLPMLDVDASGMDH